MGDIPEFKFCILPSVGEAIKEYKSDLTEVDFLPTRSEPLATGWDVRCATPGGLILKPGCYVKIPLGIKVFSPPGWWLKLNPRSSTLTKRHIHSLYGVIDEAYEGSMYFCGQYITDACEITTRTNPARIEFGERIGQLIPVRREEMAVRQISEDEFAKLSNERDSHRKDGGFGSTGNV